MLVVYKNHLHFVWCKLHDCYSLHKERFFSSFSSCWERWKEKTTFSFRNILLFVCSHKREFEPEQMVFYSNSKMLLENIEIKMIAKMKCASVHHESTNICKTKWKDKKKLNRKQQSKKNTQRKTNRKLCLIVFNIHSARIVKRVPCQKWMPPS